MQEPLPKQATQSYGPAASEAYTFFTVSKVAKILKVSYDTVIRLFDGRRGVLDLGYPEQMHKRQYRMLRISKAALDAFIEENGVIQ